MQQNEQAIVDCRVAISLDPNYAKAWGRLATSLSALGKHIEAAEAFKQAMEIEPEIPSWKEGYERETASAGGAGAGPGMGGAGGTPGGASPFSGASPNFLMNLMQSPQMMQMAQQMMSDPNMSQMMQGVLSSGQGGGMPQNMDGIMNMAQNFASQMASSNPELINRLRNQYGGGNNNNPGGQGGDGGAAPL